MSVNYWDYDMKYSLLLMLLLTGCGVGMDTVYTDHYRAGQEKCMTMGGLDYIKSNDYLPGGSTLNSYYFQVEVRCKDKTDIEFQLNVER